MGNQPSKDEEWPVVPSGKLKGICAYKYTTCIPHFEYDFLPDFSLFRFELSLSFFNFCQKEREICSSEFPLPVLKTRLVIYFSGPFAWPLVFPIVWHRFLNLRIFPA